MGANTFGHLFQMHSWGESHGKSMGTLVTGCPSGIRFDQDFLQKQLDRRRPGNWNVGDLNSPRKESDIAQLHSGVFGGVTIGTPIMLMFLNEDAKSESYLEIKDNPRTGHADEVWKHKFGVVDHRGGGRASGRETVSRVAAGAIAEMGIKHLFPNVKVIAFASCLGNHSINIKSLYGKDNPMFNQIESGQFDRTQVDKFNLRFPDSNHQNIFNELKEVRKNGSSWGGAIDLIVTGLPKGLGQPVFAKFKADLTAALLSIGATCGVQFGNLDKTLNESISINGSDFHQSDSFSQYGGIQGGISTGKAIGVRIFFKPTSSILDVAKKGRHDPCIVPRAVPVVEAMAAMVIFDHILWSRSDRI